MKAYQITIENFATKQQTTTPTTAHSRKELLKVLADYVRYYRVEFRKVSFLTVNI